MTLATDGCERVPPSACGVENGSRTLSTSAPLFLTNVTPTTRGPALTGTRTASESSGTS